MRKYTNNLNKICHEVSKLSTKQIQQEIHNIHQLPIHPQEKKFVMETLRNHLTPRKFSKLSFGNTQLVIDIITDLGEECDDEVTIFCAILNASLHPDTHFNIVFTDPHWRKSASRAGIEPKLKMKNVTFYDLLSIPETKSKPSRVLQIGPVKINVKYYSNLKEFDYYIVGTIGNTLNSLTGADTFANMMISNSTNHYIIDTKRGLGAPQFNIQVLENLPQNEYLCKQSLLNHVINIGFRNTVGRAEAFYGKFLVSKPNGANYKTVKNQVDVLRLSEAKHMSDVLNLDDSDYNKTYIKRVVSDYFSKIDVEPSDNDKEGYYFILDKLFEIYGIPPQIYVSGAPGGWNPSWNSLFYGEKLSNKTDPVLGLEKQLQNFKSIVNEYSLPLTPAYDCVGLYATLLGKDIDQHFTEEIKNTWVLNGVHDPFNSKENNDLLKKVIMGIVFKN